MKEHPDHANHQQTVIDFLRTLEIRNSADDLDRFYHPEVEQIEFPNAITPQTAHRSLADLKAGAEKGKALLTQESYEVKEMHAAGSVVVLECTWKGTLALPVGRLKPGEQMVAHFAQVFEFKDGKIYRQRNYDCFEPFG